MPVTFVTCRIGTRDFAPSVCSAVQALEPEGATHEFGSRRVPLDERRRAGHGPSTVLAPSHGRLAAAAGGAGVTPNPPPPAGGRASRRSSGLGDVVGSTPAAAPSRAALVYWNCRDAQRGGRV